MDWKKQFKVHDLSFRDTCIVLLVIAVNLLILMFILPMPPKREAVSRCASHQRWIHRIMSRVPDGEGFELPSEWTVADLIREAVRKDRQSPRPLPEETFICRNTRDERVFLVRRGRVEVTSQYLVFPVSASVVFDESLQPPVPILMCPPGAHDGRHCSMVLYSDGTTKPMTPEEAEKLVSEYSPVPIEEVYRNDTEENRVLEEADTALPAPAQLNTEEK